MVRLAMALNDAGFTVDAVCLPRHPLQKTKAAHKTYAYKNLAPLRSLASAITASRPDLIIPGDDLATMQLHALYQREFNRGRKGALICSVIERSLGSPSSFPQVYARTGLLKIAQEEGIRVPRTEVLTDVNQLREWGARTGFPAVLKSNGSSGGEGVSIVHSLEQAERAFRTLNAPPLLARAVKRALMDGDKTLILPSLLRRRSGLNIQEYVPGHEATSAVVCWQGTLLAGLHFEVLSKTTPTGPASVMRLIDSCEMSIVAEKIVKRLNLSGLVGFDFMLEEQTSNPYLIEVNPRATQVGHLTLGPGHDLPGAFYAAVTGEAIREAPKITENRTIALFPQEWKRNPESSFLQSGYHDVPWEEPELIRAFAHSSGKHKALDFEKERVRELSPLGISNQ
jgi:formate-dependent phosphoribosylglycinamide formyltransferase (GAR transformylase)